jgi:anti-sigma28 factor (negative regulator of flagellin synthesis)
MEVAGFLLRRIGMHLDNGGKQLTSDLKTLSAAAAGHPDPHAGNALTEEERLRFARIEELRAQFQAGTLAVDSNRIASKIIDGHLREKREQF